MIIIITLGTYLSYQQLIYYNPLGSQNTGLKDEKQSIEIRYKDKGYQAKE